MTNFEKIKSMSVEEMVEFVYNNCYCICCSYSDDLVGCNNGTNCMEGHKQWLESEVEE